MNSQQGKESEVMNSQQVLALEGSLIHRYPNRNGNVVSQHFQAHNIQAKRPTIQAYVGKLQILLQLKVIPITFSNLLVPHT